ncbi:C40 family peptidase [Streptomyces verrucosisporus]|uniref:C40 family peptidase n=1 Tax=Streptomyces verrucosisporus TaxID=1695161 RepID=UPI0019D30958|nr:C40 family peptidase [Streptomyces verrucosisporus]MBN3933210.1 C40 family peptidase [Streptomyces verrucosisporus]
MKTLAAGIGVVVLSPVLLGGAAMLTAGSSEAAVRGSASRCLPDLDTDKVTEQVAEILDGADASGVDIEGLELPGEQIPHAQTIVVTGADLRIPRRGQIIALATAIQESRLRNLDYGDRDSLGLFQQRPSQGWGTAEQIRDPVYASERFYTALVRVSGWQQMTVTQAAQAVQKSGYPDAYAQWEPLATALQTAIAATFPGAGHGAGQEGDDAPPLSECATEDGSSFGKIPEGAVPDGYKVPEDADPRARTAIVWAMHQLGTMYQWGGTCTAPHGPDPMGRCDCSSLMQQAYAEAGVRLTRTTYTQVGEGEAVSPNRLRPGDLIFSRGTAARPEHVGMYMGQGLVIEAPRTGKPVRITPLKDWDVLAVRRVL